MSKLPRYSVSNDGVPNFLGDDEADFRIVKAGNFFIFHIAAGEGKSHMAVAGANPVEGGSELFFSSHAIGGWEHVNQRLSSEPGATLVSTTCNNCTTCACAHALAEAVNLMTATIIWLKSTFHHVFSSPQYLCEVLRSDIVYTAHTGARTYRRD